MDLAKAVRLRPYPFQLFSVSAFQHFFRMRLPLTLALCAGVSVFAQAAVTDDPDPREIPPPPIPTPIAHLPGPEALPAHPGLPDVFTFIDGSRVRGISRTSTCAG